ncbi:hypothetical protein JWG45_03420 [Leptospira sp. 201903070]|uniref:Uncharacterized protein n=1 Tax=Leptospira ainlahdjerensis TaxID=2810033 RepID=A0ABS2U761_9LEPT|nr:hypothetical protein [Leptospira ainlahdjerensis]
MSSLFQNDSEPEERIHGYGNPILIFKLCIIGLFCFGLLLDFPSPIFSQNEPNQKSQEQPESKPLLRVFPSFRKEECDWAIRWDICLNCLRIGRRYAQKIHFYPSGPYREHGCYSEEEGFFLLEE